jgi:hypothetical protein
MPLTAVREDTVADFVGSYHGRAVNIEVWRKVEARRLAGSNDRVRKVDDPAGAHAVGVADQIGQVLT